MGDSRHHATPATVLRRALVLTFLFAGVEAVTGWWTGSLALLGDAGHMVADSAGLGLALIAALVSARRPSPRFTYGLGRVEVVAAVVNGLLLVALVAWLAVEAIARIRAPTPVSGGPALVVAMLGGVMNLLIARMLRTGEQTINVRAAFLHVLGDLLGSAAAVASNAIVLLTGWMAADPILSLAIGCLILLSAVRIVREGARILLEGTPAHLSVEDVGRAMAGVAGVASVHDLHLWQVSSRVTALSAHLVVTDPGDWHGAIRRVNVMLAERFGIEHATLQPELPEPPVQVELGPPPEL